MKVCLKIRVVGDVHGDTRGFAMAAATDRLIIQLGDLVDDGPDSAGALRLMFRLVAEQRGVFLLGNHDYKLARALRGAAVKPGGPTDRTLAELTPELREQALAEILRAPAWMVMGDAFFVHGSFHPGMLREAPPEFPAGRPGPLLARALYGQTTGRTTGAGKPERLLDWVEDIPAAMTVYCGHDRRSVDGRPYVRANRQGGRAVFLDTGAGKGGHLSWIDLEV